MIRSCLGALYDAFLNVRGHCTRTRDVEGRSDATLFFGKAVFPDSASKSDGFSGLGRCLVRSLQCGADHVDTQV